MLFLSYGHHTNIAQKEDSAAEASILISCLLIGSCSISRIHGEVHEQFLSSSLHSNEAEAPAARLTTCPHQTGAGDAMQWPIPELPSHRWPQPPTEDAFVPDIGYHNAPEKILVPARRNILKKKMMRF